MHNIAEAARRLAGAASDRVFRSAKPVCDWQGRSGVCDCVDSGGGLPSPHSPALPGQLGQLGPCAHRRSGAKNERILTFDNVGVGGTTGVTPSTIGRDGPWGTHVCRRTWAQRRRNPRLLDWQFRGAGDQGADVPKPWSTARSWLSLPPGERPGCTDGLRKVINRSGKVPRNSPEGYLEVFFTRSEASRSAGLSRAQPDVLARGRPRRLDDVGHPPLDNMTVRSGALQTTPSYNASARSRYRSS